MNNKSVKSKMLVLVIPTVAIGLILMATVIFNYVKSEFEAQILSSSTRNTLEVGEQVSEWLDKRMLETAETASTPIAKTVNAELLNQNNIYRYGLMKQRYPGVVDSVSWGPFDGSGVLYGETSNGFKEMHNADKAWYKQTMKGTQDSFMSSPVVSQATGKIIVNSIAVARDDSGKPVSMILAAIYVQSVMDKVQSCKLGEQGYSLLVSKEGVYIVNPDDTAIMKKNILEESDPALAELGQKMLSGSDGVFQFTSSAGDKLIAFYTPIKSTGWGMATVAYEDELFAPVANVLKIMAVISVILLVLISTGIWLTVNKIMSPLAVMMDEIRLLSKGDFRERPSRVTSSDELGLLANAVTEMRKNVSEVMHSVNSSAESLSGSAEELNATTEQSSVAANQVAQSIVRVAASTSQQLDAVNDTSQAIEHLNESIQAMASDAAIAADKSRQASDVAREGEITLQQAIEQIKTIERTSQQTTNSVMTLGENSKQIGQIVGTISGIAEQTNLLALNAAIEAARAGEAGKGFAVVADEVRKLAESSKEAAQQISDLIKITQDDTDKAIKDMEVGGESFKVGAQNIISMGEAFRKIAGIVEQVSAQMQIISSSTRDMATNGKQIVQNIRTIGEASKTAAEEAETVSAATQEQTASVHEIAGESTNLARMAGELQQEVKKFKV
ncbi:MAG: methyl-accepting chemotaxis protein [Selenomonadaceae bacterium]|nr:methyl-accepting chemotaxis protein [Selenomonadaceae bacterium]